MALLFLLSLVAIFTSGMSTHTTRGGARFFFGVLFVIALLLGAYAFVSMFLMVLPH